ncbi:Imm7 family immunity protein [Nocardiopsis sp. RSe5-2]|uniref:Imm7 family immunity protein n=1 Tax=Nocardiopsis endophytica TaxID=3018445 RepID=A0ABT4U295_9ACTN|nr:Imm7 family immunity protein [Nocardiopsis endophytica]MDA2811057.1 Imm7 family immunity protein [Nocardiopsis endophytica]
MFEFHGWLAIQGSAAREDDEPDQDVLRRLVESASGGSSLVDLRWINGELFLHVGGLLNRRSSEADEVVDLFERIGSVALGSYGVLYYRDDEKPGNDGNAFHVLAMRRGQVTEEPDGHLSPVIPRLEDPYSPEDD